MAGKMKKRFIIIASVLAVSILCGCVKLNVNVTKPADGGDTPNFPQLTSVDYDLSRYDEDKTKYFDCHGNTWSLTKDSEKDYPKLAAALKDIDDNEKKFFNDSLEQYDSEAKEFVEENKKNGYDGGSYECYADTGLAVADPKVVSLVKSQETFFGGAHPDDITIAFNIDSQSGQLIPLSAVVSDKKGLNALLKNKLVEQYTDHAFFGLDESLDALGMAQAQYDYNSNYTEKPQYIYSFAPDGMTFYFNPAILSPSSDGGEQVYLSYDELANVLDNRFKP